eukprot:scaffold25231_cov34-Prasinocladus_malaysianus.AAC.4
MPMSSSKAKCIGCVREFGPVEDGCYAAAKCGFCKYHCPWRVYNGEITACSAKLVAHRPPVDGSSAPSQPFMKGTPKDMRSGPLYGSHQCSPGQQHQQRETHSLSASNNNDPPPTAVEAPKPSDANPAGLFFEDRHLSAMEAIQVIDHLTIKIVTAVEHYSSGITAKMNDGDSYDPKSL